MPPGKNKGKAVQRVNIAALPDKYTSEADIHLTRWNRTKHTHLLIATWFKKLSRRIASEIHIPVEEAQRRLFEHIDRQIGARKEMRRKNAAASSQKLSETEVAAIHSDVRIAMDAITRAISLKGIRDAELLMMFRNHSLILPIVESIMKTHRLPEADARGIVNRGIARYLFREMGIRKAGIPNVTNKQKAEIGDFAKRLTDYCFKKEDARVMYRSPSDVCGNSQKDIFDLSVRLGLPKDVVLNRLAEEIKKIMIRKKFIKVVNRLQ